MQRDECIYNLIPRVVIAPMKPERYRSKHDPKTAPTGSTFCTKGSTRLPGSSLSHSAAAQKPSSARGFGRVQGKPDPKQFTKKGERCTSSVDPRKRPTKFSYDGQKRPPVVRRDEKPIMGLKSSKNYVTANAVEAILAVPGHRARPNREPPRYVEKEDYGQVPRYLNQVKDEIERENALIEEFVRQNKNMLDEEEGNRVEMMDESERKELVNALKAKWDHVNAKYQKLCHNVVFDTLGKVRRKETFEKELAQLEKDIEMLEKGQVIVTHSHDRY